LRKEFANIGLELASKLGAEYADIRFVDGEQRMVSIKNKKPDRIFHKTGSGFGVQRIVDKGWGFAGSYKVSREEIIEAVETAVKIAKASSMTRKNEIKLAKTKVVEAKYETKITLDPLSYPLEDIIVLLKAADEAFRENSPHVRMTSNFIHSRMENKYLATSEGSKINQKIVFCGGQGQGYTIKNGLVQRRTYDIPPRTIGFEYIKSLDLQDIARRAGEEAEILLTAEHCPKENDATLIMDDSQLFLNIHESIGHGSELDRVLGTESDLSFLTPDKRGTFRYGSDIVNFVADPTIETGLGTYGYDDEGVPARKVYLVKNGIFVGYQSSRETAMQIGDEESSSSMRAASSIDLPLIRMNNINLLPGDWKRDEIIEDTKKGILMRAMKAWSIDQKRLNFQYGCEIGWRIKNGELTDVIRDPTYTGISYKFWRNVDAIAKDDWQLYSSGCGKGRPGQSMYVGHGAASYRVRNIRIGVMEG
jgi:TldD protein